MFIKPYLFALFILLNLHSVSQELKLVHHISSDQIYTIKLDQSEQLEIYLNFYSPRIVDYKALPYFFVSGWYKTNKNTQKYNLVGVYHPTNKLVLFVPKDQKQKYIDCIDHDRLNIDTTSYLERFDFPLNEKVNKTKNARWFNGNKTIFIENIDVDNKNVHHKIFLTGGDLNRHTNRSIDITDFVINPFGKNDIFLEDYNIKIHSSYTDDLENLHIVLYITNEYVIPSSLSSGGYYYLRLDKNQIIRDNKYIETYNQGKYISYIDETFIHPSKQRFLILSDWSDGQIIGSFFIENAIIEIEKEWDLVIDKP